MVNKLNLDLGLKKELDGYNFDLGKIRLGGEAVVSWAEPYSTPYGESIFNSVSKLLFDKKVTIKNILKLLLRKLPKNKKVIRKRKKNNILMKKLKQLCINREKLFKNKKYDKKIDKIVDKIIKNMGE